MRLTINRQSGFDTPTAFGGERKDQERVVVVPKFADLLPPLTEDELETLHNEIVREGRIRDPLRVYIHAGYNVLLDGHSRLGIALHLGLGYTLAPVPVDGIEDAERWVLANQRARRNMRPEALQLLRGRLYNLEKRQGGRTHTYTSRQSGEKLPAQRLAGEFGVGARTIERDGALVEALDAITAEHGRQLLDAYVSGEKGLTRKHVLKVASLSSNRRGEFIKHVCEVKVPVGEALSYALKPEWSDEQVANAEAALTAQAQLLAQAIEGARGALGEVAPAMERWALRTRPKDHAAVVAFRAAQKKVADGLKAMTELLPHRPCDDCLGNDPSCAECAGVGWFPKGRASWDM